MNDALVGNSTDKEQVKRGRKIEQERRRRDLEDMRTILALPAGRRFYWRLLGECGIFKTSFTGNSTTFFNEGMRQVGLKLLGDLAKADPTAYLKIVEESGRANDSNDIDSQT